jgi:hypothetical protein
VRRAPGRGAAFLIEDRLWRISSPGVSSADVAASNSSAVGETSQQEWDGYERGLDLVGPPR